MWKHNSISYTLFAKITSFFVCKEKICLHDVQADKIPIKLNDQEEFDQEQD